VNEPLLVISIVRIEEHRSVEVVHSACNLLHDTELFGLPGQIGVRLEVVRKISSLTVLEHAADQILLPESTNQHHYVLVLQLFHEQALMPEATENLVHCECSVHCTE